ncbi:sulfurtransferase TusA family protein [Evansella sp. AB-rgal1]|uniref:sulfurtransferase TusA family protein n=1 Tax=Evansella sp. AB-rgal1 TaxID=3242696 RepID=UPI00359E1DCE
MIKTDNMLDAKGLACPMPIVKTKKVMNDLLPGQVLEVQATDKGSTADLRTWSERVGHHYIGTVEEGDVLKHYLRKASDVEETREETKHSVVTSNKELQQKLDSNEDIIIIDVREEAEYSFNHIPGSKNIPIGVLEKNFGDLNKNGAVYVVCRTGYRSDLAAQKLTENGFTNVTNVVPGMSKWSGTTGSNVGSSL